MKGQLNHCPEQNVTYDGTVNHFVLSRMSPMKGQLNHIVLSRMSPMKGQLNHIVLSRMSPVKGHESSPAKGHLNHFVLSRTSPQRRPHACSTVWCLILCTECGV